MRNRAVFLRLAEVTAELGADEMVELEQSDIAGEFTEGELAELDMYFGGAKRLLIDDKRRLEEAGVREAKRSLIIGEVTGGNRQRVETEFPGVEFEATVESGCDVVKIWPDGKPDEENE